MFSNYVEIWDLDHYVLAADPRNLSRWTERGYALADRVKVFCTIDRALAAADDRQLTTIWSALFGPVPARRGRRELEADVREAALRRYTLGAERVARPGRAPTDDAGWLEETLPLVAREVVLHLLEPSLSFEVALGHLDPAHDEQNEDHCASGVAQRLSALGYAPGAVGETLGQRAALALAAFQADELERDSPSGEVDAETLNALTRAYGA